MHSLLSLVLAASNAHATDLSWTCTTVTAAADVVAWRGRNLGAAQAGAAAFDALRARVDADCLADCSDPLGYFCLERTCMTATGDRVTWSTDLSEEPNYYDDASHYLTTVHIVVEPALEEGRAWTRAEVTYRYAGSYRAYAVTWEGRLDPRWPLDGSFSASEAADSGLSTERWTDASCAWVVESGYTIGGERVTMNGTDVWVSDPLEDRGCGVSLAELGGARASLDGVSQGMVDVATWLPLPGTDADGDLWLAEHGDCDDADPAVNCDAPDVPYDGIDQDCWGGDRIDADGDGVRGDDGTDCDDTNRTVYPGAPDLSRDGTDQDCDGTDGIDADGDGYAATAPGRRPDADDDCDDADPDAYPGAPETWRDDVDQDCDGRDGVATEDWDMDGWADDEDCAPTDACVNPGAAEAVGADGVDSNCDGVDGPDPDGDGIASGADCAPADARIHPGATDTPEDGIDQDCDGVDATATGDTSGYTSEPPAGCGCVTAGQRDLDSWDGGGPAPRRNASPGADVLGGLLAAVVLRARRNASRGVRARRLVA